MKRMAIRADVGSEATGTTKSAVEGGAGVEGEGIINRLFALPLYERISRLRLLINPWRDMFAHCKRSISSECHIFYQDTHRTSAIKNTRHRLRSFPWFYQNISKFASLPGLTIDSLGSACAG